MAIDTTSPHSRRALLAGAVGGVAAFAAHAFGRLPPMAAATGGNVILGQTNEANDVTIVRNTLANGGALSAYGKGIGYGIYGVSDGIGVRGESTGGTAPSVSGHKLWDGVAVQGDIDKPTSGWTAVYGTTNGTGVGVVGENTANGPGTWGKAAGTGDGVYGESASGRGGRFKGKKAQLKLEPSTTSTHPSSGAAGDIFLDKSKRLWLCKGGTSWVRIV